MFSKDVGEGGILFAPIRQLIKAVGYVFLIKLCRRVRKFSSILRV